MESFIEINQCITSGFFGLCLCLLCVAREIGGLQGLDFISTCFNGEYLHSVLVSMKFSTRLVLAGGLFGLIENRSVLERLAVFKRQRQKIKRFKI